MVIRVVTVDIALVVSGMNLISVSDAGLFVDVELIREGFPELVLLFAVIHTILSEEAGLYGSHPLWVQSILADALRDLAMKTCPFI